MSAQQYRSVMKLLELLMLDGVEAHIPEAFTLHAVVHDVTETAQLLSLLQCLFCLLYRRCHAEAEARTVVYFYYHLFSFKSE